MTFKELQRLIESQSEVNFSSTPKELLLAKLRNKPFWLWDSSLHKHKSRMGRGHCCFNHIIGCPKKDGIEKPFFDYEKMLYLALIALMEPAYINNFTGAPGIPAYNFKVKHVWVKKSVGLGVPACVEITKEYNEAMSKLFSEHRNIVEDILYE